MKQAHLRALLLVGCVGCAASVSSYASHAAAETAPSRPLAAVAPDAGAPALVGLAIIVRPALEPRYASFRGLPTAEAVKAQAARSALYRRLATMPAATEVPVDLLALARQEGAIAFGTTRSAEEIASFAPFILMETMNAVQEDAKELVDARAIVATQLEALKPVVAKQPPRRLTPVQLAEARARSVAQRTRRLQVQYMLASTNAAVAKAVAALVAEGATAEQIQLFIAQEQLNALSEACARLSAISRAYHEQARSIIQNLRA